MACRVSARRGVLAVEERPVQSPDNGNPGLGQGIHLGAEKDKLLFLDLARQNVGDIFPGQLLCWLPGILNGHRNDSHRLQLTSQRLGRRCHPFALKKLTVRGPS